MTKPPRLEKLKTETCTLEELQAALVQLIELHNALDAEIRSMKTNGQIMSRHDAIMNTSFSL